MNTSFRGLAASTLLVVACSSNLSDKGSPAATPSAEDPAPDVSAGGGIGGATRTGKTGKRDDGAPDAGGSPDVGTDGVGDGADGNGSDDGSRDKKEPSGDTRGEGGEGDGAEVLGLPPGWTPEEFEPLVWYSAGVSADFVDLIDGTVSVWKDRSGNGHNVVQTATGFRPALQPTGWNGNRPTLSFNGTTSFLRDNGWQAGVSPHGVEKAFTVLAVVEPSAIQRGGIASWYGTNGGGWISTRLVAPGGGNLFGEVRRQGVDHLPSVGNDVYTFTGATNVSASRHVIAYRFGYGRVRITVDGRTDSNQTLYPPLTAVGNTEFLIGREDTFFANDYAGKLSELIVIGRELDDADIQTYREYAQAQWGGLSTATDDCSLQAPFGVPVAAFTGTTIAEGFTFSQDGLTAYVSSKFASSTYDIYVTTRTSTSAPFGALTSLGPIFNKPYWDERSPSLSLDGMRLYLSNGIDVLVSTRTSMTDFSAHTPVSVGAPVRGDFAAKDPFFRTGTNELYFSSEADHGTGNPLQRRNIFVSTWQNGTFTTPVGVGPSVNLSNEEDDRPIVSPDGLTLYFASLRPGIGSDTGGDIWITKRNNLTEQFGTVTNLSALNTSVADFPAGISSNGCTLYFASTRDTGTLNHRLYQAKRGLSIPSRVTTTIKVFGTGSVITPGYQCSSTCAFQGVPDTTVYLQANGTALWTGSCTSNSGNPSTDGVFVFTPGGTCTVTFGTPGGPDSGCNEPSDCQSGLECTLGTCRCPASGPCSAACPCDTGGSCTTDDQCQPGLECMNGECSGCSNGERDSTEECDDGTGSEGDLCSATCQVTDALAVRGSAQGESRYLGESRHPVSAGPLGFAVAFVEPDPEPPVIGVSVFDPAGDPRARISVSSGSTPVLFSSPAVAAIDDGSYAVAWTDFGRDGDELGVALRRVRPIAASGSSPPASGLDLGATLSTRQFANGTTEFSQYDADLLRVGNQLVVAWTDTSNASTAPDIRYRTFDVGTSGSNAPFRAVEAEQVLTAEGAFEGNVALAPFGQTWAAAWRSSLATGEETIEVALPSEGLSWSLGPDLPGAPEDRPAVAELDAEHLAVLYSVGTDPQETSVSNVSRLKLAVLSLAQAEPVVIYDFDQDDLDYQDPSVAQSHPSLVRAGSVLYAAWRTASLFGDPEAENVFLRELTWSTELEAAAEYRIPRTAAGSLGDQRFPALAVGPTQVGTPGLPDPAPQGSLVVAWDDYGRVFGAATEGRPDVIAQFWPLPVLRLDQSGGP